MSPEVPAAARGTGLRPPGAHGEGVEMGPQASLTAANGYRFQEPFPGLRRRESSRFAQPSHSLPFCLQQIAPKGFYI